MLDTKEGETDLYRLVRQRDRAGKDDKDLNAAGPDRRAERRT